MRLILAYHEILRKSMIGTKVGPYELLEEIGRGGMATVYRAYQRSVDRSVAIKIIMKQVAGDAQAVQRFQREARMIARLEHPHILPVYDFDGGHEPPYIVMRYLSGGTLKEVMQQGSLPLAEINCLMQQVCSALDYAHRQGITHRDIKPSNIMIDREGNAFVTDFGLARLVAGHGADRQITDTGTVMGTPDYMSPEQAAKTGDIDHRADIYALGVILFQMLTGRLPFVANHPVGVLMMHMQEPVPSVVDYNPTLPLEVDDVISLAMAKAPEERYASAAAFAAAVTATLGGSISTAPLQLQTAATQSIILRRKRMATGQRSVADTDSKVTPSEQQKQVTVLYANLTEFMEMVEAETGDPLEIRQSLWKRLDLIIAEYGGVIETHFGDTVLALWGVRSVSEDDPERAVRAALAMRQEVMAAAATILAEDDREPLPVQIGVHTGITLLIRSQESGVYRASGSTVNMAIRLERVVPVGSILISANTYNYVRGIFLVEGLEPVHFRGSRQAVPVYLVKGVKPRAFRQRIWAVEGVKPQLIGREAELKQLIEVMEIAMEAETQVVTIVGEAGLGKSRLLDELSEWEDKLDGDFWYFPVQTTPQMINRPFALFREMFSYRFEIQESDDLTQVQEKFERGLAGLMGPDTTEQAHVMAHLLGFTFPDSPYLQNRDPAQLSYLAQSYMIEFFVTAAKRTTGFAGSPDLGVWLHFENIHWADDRSLDFINHLVENQPGLRLVITCTARPLLYERRPTWGSGQDFHQRLELRPLSRRDSRKLVNQILQKVEHIPDELRDLLVDRAEGNPFYMEELVKMLVEDRVILKGDDRWLVELDRLAQARVPATLTGLLQARLDSLLPEERLTLQRAAVVGRVFWNSAVKALQAADDAAVDVDHALAVLTRRELIFRREETAFSGMKEYIFKSTILRDVIYDSILRRQQRAYHLEVARWLVEVAGARAGEHNTLVAEHYEIAGKSELAVEYLIRAGEQVALVGAYVEASGFFERGLKLIKPMTGADALRLQATLRYQLGDAYIDRGQYAAGDRHLKAGLSIAREVGDRKYIVQALINLGKSNAKQGLLEAAWVYLQEGLALAREVTDRIQMARALRWLGTTARFQQRFDQAETYMLEALALARECDDRVFAAPILNALGETARYQGRHAEAIGYYQEALSIFRMLGDQAGVALIMLNLGHVAAASSKIGTASTHYLEALRLYREVQLLSFVLETLAGLAGLKAASDEPEQALELLGLALNHPACAVETRLLAEPILAKLRAELPPDLVEAALEQGRQADLDTVLQELLVETVV
jgi:serine/threonine protein kinase/tetratricopeptide (TPR) repeat protein